MMQEKIRLYDLVRARSGDKGNRLNIAVYCQIPEMYQALHPALNEKFVHSVFRHRSPTSIVRYEVPNLNAYNFVLDDALEGGVNSSLGLDGHGKTLSFLLLSAYVDLTPGIQAARCKLQARGMS